MKKKSVLKLLILMLVALVIVLTMMYFVLKSEAKSISKEKLEEIQTYFANTEFLNCVYNSPEEIKPEYIFSVSERDEEQTQEDKAEYLYLAFASKIESLYPEVFASNSLSDAEKIAYIKADLLRENEETELKYKKFSYNLVQKILFENTTLSEQEVVNILEQLKTSDNVLYSKTYDCFYFSEPSKNEYASVNSLKCVKGRLIDNKYTVTYTLEFSDTITDTIEYEVCFYEDENGIYKFISNRCTQAEETLKKAQKFEESFGNSVKTIETEDGSVYAYKEVTSKEGDKYNINGGQSTAYCKILYIKTDSIDYYFMDDGYVYFDKSEKTKYYYMNCYPKGVTVYDFKYLQEKFANAIKNT